MCHKKGADKLHEQLQCCRRLDGIYTTYTTHENSRYIHIISWKCTVQFRFTTKITQLLMITGLHKAAWRKEQTYGLSWEHSVSSELNM